MQTGSGKDQWWLSPVRRQQHRGSTAQARRPTTHGHGRSDAAPEPDRCANRAGSKHWKEWNEQVEPSPM